MHFTYCKYKNLRNTKSLQCPQWPLPRKGRPLLMTRRNDRTLSPLHLMHCVILHLEIYTLNLIHCIFHIAHSILHITSYALYFSYWILHIASYILHLRQKKWKFQKIPAYSRVGYSPGAREPGSHEIFRLTRNVGRTRYHKHIFSSARNVMPQ